MTYRQARIQKGDEPVTREVEYESFKSNRGIYGSRSISDFDRMHLFQGQAEGCHGRCA
jgi:hypothetical protein